METLIALAIFGLITSALYTLFILGIKIVTDDKARVGARVLGEQKMEIIKNLSYADIGTIGGVPAGKIIPLETTILNSVEYTIKTDIHYHDDDNDGLAPIDLVNVDYKKVRIQVDWKSHFNSNPIILVCDIVPKDLESLNSGGTLWLEVYDSAANPVSGATVQILNNTVFPTVNITSATNAQGVYALPGAIPSTQSYQVLISQPGYTTAQTYLENPLTNPNPDPAPLSVGIGDVTNKIFIINPLADLQLEFILESGSPLADFTFTLKGNETIGSDGEGNPILKYQQSHTTNSNGIVSLTNINPQAYSIEFDPITTGYDLAGYSPDLPYILTPDSAGIVQIVLAVHATNSLLTTVKNGLGEPQSEAIIRLYTLDLIYDQTKVSNSAGQVFFSPLTQGSYYISIIKNGFDPINFEVNINAQTEQKIQLSAI